MNKFSIVGEKKTRVPTRVEASSILTDRQCSAAGSKIRALCHLGGGEWGYGANNDDGSVT